MEAPADPQVTLIYDREHGIDLPTAKREVFTVTHDLATAMARAALVNEKQKTPLSFMSLLIGMATESGSWLEGELARQGSLLQKVAETRGFRYDPNNLRSVSPPTTSIEYLTSESARAAITEARSIATKIEDGSAVDVRHLCAAYPVLKNWHQKDFKELRIDRLAWCRHFGVHMANAHQAEKWYWREYADRASPVPLTSFSADVYTETDLLGIDRSVDALALLIASTRTDTPLSIGVFGPWGSGKSFFMRHLRKEIMRLAVEQGQIADWVKKREDGNATADDAPLYYRQVAQVEFNAWHYNESNVIASLVEHLFRNLRVLPENADHELEERRALTLLQMSGLEADAIGAADALVRARKEVDDAREEVSRTKNAVESARRDIDQTAEELNARNAQLDSERRRLDDAIRGLSEAPRGVDAGALINVALRPFAPLLGKAKQAGDEVDAAVSSWSGFVKRVLSTRGLLVVGLCVAAPLVAWLSDQINKVAATLVGTITAAIAGASNLFAVLRERRVEFEKKMKELEIEEGKDIAARRDELEKERSALAASQKEERARLAEELTGQRDVLAARETAVTAAVRDLAAKTKDLDGKVQARVSAEDKLRDVQDQLKRLSSALLLEEFIKDRAGTDEYRKQLGFLALVRRDFERLSNLIANANQEWMDPNKASAPPLLNRIVLYIDDLDRCKQSKVVEVLEAVHLLLAFPLFACVVAVDPRWVARCLRARHRGLFVEEEQEAEVGDADDGQYATVGDYLEKIFQIPIWMSPIGSRQRGHLVKSLLGPTAAPATNGRSRSAGEQALVDPSFPDPDREAGYAEDAFQELVAQASEIPDPLKITPDEAEFVDEIAPLLSERPRALKRFVNTYRLLKATLGEIDRDSFVVDGPSSPHKICISQLAFFSGQPRLAPLLVHALAERNPAHKTLGDWVGQLKSADQQGLYLALRRIPGYQTIDLAAFCSWLPDTSRYLFHRQD